MNLRLPETAESPMATAMQQIVDKAILHLRIQTERFLIKSGADPSSHTLIYFDESDIGKESARTVVLIPNDQMDQVWDISRDEIVKRYPSRRIVFATVHK